MCLRSVSARSLLGMVGVLAIVAPLLRLSGSRPNAHR